MLRDLEVVFRGHFVLQGFEFGGEKLDDPAALRTDHVIVMLMFVVVLVVRTSVAEADFARESSIGQDLEGAVNGRLPDGRVFFFYELIEIFIREVIFRSQEDVEYEVTLGGTLEPLPLDVFKKDFLLFSSWFFCRHHAWGDFSTTLREG